jgi:HJR/Mrr/RecB family endonuclease
MHCLNERAALGEPGRETTAGCLDGAIDSVATRFTEAVGAMGLFEGGRRRREQLDAYRTQLAAYRTLSALWLRHLRSISRRADWESACSALRNHWSVSAARKDSQSCAARIHYLEVAEPPPALEDFVPPLSALEDCPRVLAEVRRLHQLSLQGHPERERLRLVELETTKALYEEVKAAEVARQREWQQGRWPRGVVLDREIYKLDGVEAQVDRQNAKIESQVNAVSDLLQEGLQNPPVVSETASYRAGDPAGIAAHVESVLAAMRLPHCISPKAKVAYSPDSRQVVVEYELPTVDVVPKAKSYRYVKSRETVVETARPASQVKALYASIIAQLTLLCVAAIFESDSKRHIDVVVFNGVVDTLDPRSGQPIRPCLITVRVTRDTFAEINLARVDPVACLKYLNAGISTSPTELAPVRPVLEFSMVDPRFIAETDTLGALDDRPNLMELTPQQFESLIQNLFEKIGLDTRQTRPSRDGGVDCVAYNTDPILGGKVVIQAKRYKNTVGVSAVRDLYGTLQNEGASKGILVTTSQYGKASYDFAEGKPIELFDGTNLLYLLETHAGIKARIEPPDDWQDPVPDSGEPPDWQ